MAGAARLIAEWVGNMEDIRSSSRAHYVASSSVSSPVFHLMIYRPRVTLVNDCSRCSTVSTRTAAATWTNKSGGV